MQYILRTSIVRTHIVALAILINCWLYPAVPAIALDTDKNLAQCRLDIWTAKDGLPPRDIQAIARRRSFQEV